jgi:hypothetical protein
MFVGSARNVSPRGSAAGSLVPVIWSLCQSRLAVESLSGRADPVPVDAWKSHHCRDIFLIDSPDSTGEPSRRGTFAALSVSNESQLVSAAHIIPEESMFTRRHFVVAMFGLALSACGGSKSRSAPIPQPRTTGRVENQGFSDMTIYAIRSGQRVRLGTAGGNSTTTFTIPANLIFGATPLRFLADPIGANRTPVSDEITVQPGDQVRLVLPPR